MLPEVVRAVGEFAIEGRARFRASAIAHRAGVNVDQARRDLVSLSRAGQVEIAF